MLAPWKKTYDKPRQHIKTQRHFADKGPYSQSYGISSSHVWMWELNHKGAQAPNIDAYELWCWSPLDSKEIKSVNPKGNQPWIFIGRTDAEAETPIFGHLIQITDSLEKTLMLRKIEGRRRRGWQRMRWLDGIINLMDMSLSKLQELDMHLMLVRMAAIKKSTNNKC